MAPTSEEIEKIRRMRLDGASYDSIGKVLGRTRNAIAGICFRHGIKGATVNNPKPKKPRTLKSEMVVKSLEPPPPPAPTDEEPFYGSEAVVNLKNHQCRWPMGDPKAADFRYCCKAKKPGAAYCDEHAKRAYVPNVKRTAQVPT